MTTNSSHHLCSRIVTLVAASLLASQAEAQSLTYGPILGRGQTGDQMIIHWGTSGTMDPTDIAYRKKGDTTWQLVHGNGARDHEVLLSGLASGTTYEYEVRSLTGTPQGASFSTCPLPGRSLDFVFYGDSRSGPSEHAGVIAQVSSKLPDMVFESGDIVPDGSYAGYLSEFFPVVKDLAKTTPFMAAPGNHDASSPLALNYGLVFPSPRPSDAAWRAYYSFTCGNVLFIGLDSNSVGDAAQLGFLTERLAAGRNDSTIDQVFVWLHHPPYSVGSHGDNQAVQSTWVPILNQPGNKVTAVFAGHDHLYARMNDSSGVFYIVAGSAGADLSGEQQQSRAKKDVFKSVHNFVSVHVTGSAMSAVAYDDTGTEIDRFGKGVFMMPSGEAPTKGGASANNGGAIDSGCSIAAVAGGAQGGAWCAGSLLLLCVALRSRSRARRPCQR